MKTELRVGMGTKDISLDDDAYEQLEARRREGEDFSDVVKRLVGEDSWREFADVLTEEEAEEIRKTVEEGREMSQSRSDKVAERIERIK